MKKLNFLILSANAILLISCAKDIQSDFLPPEWKEVSVISEVPEDCGCNKSKVKDLLDFKSTVYGSVDSLFFQQDTINAILIDTILKTCCLVSKHGIMVGTSKICNYPEEINNWDLGKGKSVEVVISGTEFESCVGISGPPIYTYSDFILSKLLKKSKP